MWAHGLAVCVVLGALGATSLARAHPFSGYEEESVRLALEEVHRELDPAPEHKWVEAVDVVTLDVVERRDPAPRFLNWFHATSRASVIRREMLIGVGDRYDTALVEETERNLRVRQLSVVLVVPTKGSAQDRVRLLAVTKDVWSLRVNWEPVFVNGRLYSLFLQPSEENFLGRHKTVNTNLVLTPATYTVGLGFVDPRIGGTRLQTRATANLIVNCRTGGVEGSTGSFEYGKPLYSAHTRWAWVASTAWSQNVVRPGGTVGRSICSDDRPVSVELPGAPAHVPIPYQYRQDVLVGQFSALRSFGVAGKNDLSFGVEASRRIFAAPDLSSQPRAVRDAFDTLLPVSDQRLSPFVQLHAYPNRYLRVLDFETLGLQEDHALGHDVWLKAYPAARALGSTRDLAGLYTGVGYTVPVLDGLIRAYASSTIELSRVAQSDAQVVVGTRAVTPRLPFGRIIVDAVLLDRYANYLNPSQSLGGTTRLRGYRASAFVGPDVVVANLEVRSRPVEVLSVQIGAVAFYDVGDAFHDFGAMRLRHGVGGGLRFLIPELDRTVFRIDAGFPLDPRDPAAEMTVIAAFRQAFVMPDLSHPTPVLAP
jgi:hypothetical protein